MLDFVQNILKLMIGNKLLKISLRKYHVKFVFTRSIKDLAGNMQHAKAKIAVAKVLMLRYFALITLSKQKGLLLELFLV